MGVDYSAYVVFGLRVRIKEVEKALKALQVKEALPPIITRGCDHKFEEKFKFCPECGKPARIVEEQEQDDPDIFDFFAKTGLTYVTDGCDIENVFFTTANKWIHSIDLKNDNGVHAVSIPTVSEFNVIFAKLEETLTPYGIYNAKNVRMWLFGNVG